MVTIAQRLEERVMAGTLDQRREVLSAAYRRPCAVVDDHSTRHNVRNLIRISIEHTCRSWRSSPRFRGFAPTPGNYQRGLTRLSEALRERGL